jgi:hypothetical protein
MSRSIHVRALPIALALVALLLAACGGPEDPADDDDDDDDDDCAAALLAGDLVITEVMGNPEGEDEGAEWFEIYNASADLVDLTGLVLVTSVEDGSSEKAHTMTERVIAADDYLVLGDTLPEFVPEHVDYGYGNDLGALRNTAGRIVLRCGATEVDEVIYGEMSSGRSSGLDGRIPPDYTANDDLANWCDAMNEFSPGNFGTPGAENDPCMGVVNPGMCDLEGGGTRPTVAPGPGDLVITELMPDPAADPDATAEWFEITALANVDLNGLTMGRVNGEVDDTIDDALCQPIAVGDYRVFAHSATAEENGMLPQADYLFDFTLVQGSVATPGHFYIGVGDVILDEITWTDSTSGVATQLDVDLYDPDTNDDEGNWCDAVAPYGDGDLGTPGAENGQCEIPPPDGMCYDGAILRAIVHPAAGQLELSELLANPAGSSDSNKVWFELRALASFDLNELQIGQDVGVVEDTLTPSACIEVANGDHPLLARSLDMAVNGGLPLDTIDGLFGFNLVDSDGSLFIAIDGVTLDTVAWASVQSGRTVIVNDTTGTQCNAPAATTSYNTTDFGTPGLANTPECPEP